MGELGVESIRLARKSVRPRCQGFTLVELLIVVGIIGMLVGLLVPAVTAASRRTREFAIEQEVFQLALALESFKTKYGFYPPDFSRIDSLDDFRPFLNRVAPNHSETEVALTEWWDAVGLKLHRAGCQASYVFWLSGLARNKQHPLTAPDGADAGTVRDPLVAYNDGTIEREVFFEFKTDRLYYPFTTAGGTDKAGSIQHPQGLVGNIASEANRRVATYSQFTGRCAPIIYFEVKSIPSTWVWPGEGAEPWETNDANVILSGNIPSLTIAFPYEDAAGRDLNKDGFQLIAPGMDSVLTADLSPADSTTTKNVFNINSRERDNLTNFAEGRLEKALN